MGLLSAKNRPQLRRIDPRPDVKLPKIGVFCADLVEPHLVNQLLDGQSFIGKQGNSPLPIIKPHGASDHLSYLSMVFPTGRAMLSHHAAALIHILRVPVDRFPSSLIHWVE